MSFIVMLIISIILSVIISLLIGKHNLDLTWRDIFT